MRLVLQQLNPMIPLASGLKAVRYTFEAAGEVPPVL